jgi:adenosylhomocysteine nucleosidase
MGAMEEEIAAVRAALEDPRTRRVLGVEVTQGTLAGRAGARPVALALSGVGKVNAALAAAALVTAGADRVVFTGVAGGVSPDVAIGDAVVATDLVQHDIDVTAMGFEPGRLLGEPPSWVADAVLSGQVAAAAESLGARVHRGRIASGDQFVADHAQGASIRERFGAVAVEMEGAAAAQACGKLGVPVAVLRWISDAADAGAPVDFPAFLERAAGLDLAVLRAL